MTLERDQLGTMLDQWRAARPQTDVKAMEIVPRILRLAYFWEEALHELFGSLGLRRGWLDVLSALRRTSPHRLSATVLARSVLLSSGGMTARLDRMEEAGLLKRVPDPDDRRGVLVELTNDGRAVIDKAIDAQAAHIKPLISVLKREERRVFADMLRKQLIAFESRTPADQS